MDTRFITLHEMLRVIISKLGLREVQNLPIHDIIGWMGEALQHIGGYSSLETTTKKVKISNYMGRWPEDLYSIIRVEGHPKFTSKRNGFVISETDTEVLIEYERFPVDEDGMPKFPNEISTKDAIVWYVAKYLAVQGKLPNKNLSVSYCDSEWQWYCAQARAEGFTPSIDQWERMVNVFYRLIPNREEYANYFSGLNEKEDIHLDPLNTKRFD